MADIINSLRESRKVPHRYLTEYLNLRSRIGSEVLICIFEGPEDLPVYDVWIKRFAREKYEPLPVKGKENVLDLNVLVNNLKGQMDNRVLFFADTDFDGAKGRSVNDRCYFTNAYSIENLLVSEESFEELLTREFRMIAAEQPERAPLVAIFSTRLKEFNDVALEANSYIKWMRSENVDCELPNSTFQFITVTLERVQIKPNINLGELCDIFKAKALPLPAVLNGEIECLRESNLTQTGRGKFILDFFKKFIALLYADRRSQAPYYFSKPETSIGDPCHDLMRKLAGYTACPTCLETFLRKHLSASTISTNPLLKTA